MACYPPGMPREVLFACLSAYFWTMLFAAFSDLLLLLLPNVRPIFFAPQTWSRCGTLAFPQRPCPVNIGEETPVARSGLSSPPHFPVPWRWPCVRSRNAPVPAGAVRGAGVRDRRPALCGAAVPPRHGGLLRQRAAAAGDLRGSCPHHYLAPGGGNYLIFSGVAGWCLAQTCRG